MTAARTPTRTTAEAEIVSRYWPRPQRTLTRPELREIYRVARALADRLERAELWQLRLCAVSVCEGVRAELARYGEAPPDA